MKNICIATALLISTLPSAAQFSFGDSLPVRISYLQSSRRGAAHELNWAVTCFLNYANFEIQKSGDGLTYHTLHSFQADELRCRQPFHYLDTVNSKRIFYRIRVGDIDGRFYSSKTIVAYEQFEGFTITGIYPSVIYDNAMLSISASSAGKISLTVTAAGGNIVQQHIQTLHKGDNNISLAFSSLSKGVYLISVLNEKNQVQTVRAVKN